MSEAQTLHTSGVQFEKASHVALQFEPAGIVDPAGTFMFISTGPAERPGPAAVSRRLGPEQSFQTHSLGLNVEVVGHVQDFPPMSRRPCRTRQASCLCMDLKIMTLPHDEIGSCEAATY